MKKMIFSALMVIGTVAQAADLSLGWRSPEGDETPKISIHVDGATTQIRFKAERYEVKCSRWRKDLCKKEDKVDMVEVTLPANKVTVVDPALAYAYASEFEGAVVDVIMKDGSRQRLNSFQVILGLGEKKVLEYQDDGTPNGVVVPVIHNTLTFEVWGDRADGLDPLIQANQQGFMGTDPAYVVVTKSLF